MLESTWLRVGGYVVAALVCAWAGRREGRWLRAGGPRHLWPRFWYLTAGLFAVMAVARSTDLGGLLAEIGRAEARSEGWYDVRRSFQAVAIGSVVAAWLVVVVVFIWRLPPRRRRYLPTALVVGTLVSFAAVRMISLHQIDSLLHRNDLTGVRVGAVVELVLLAATIGSALWGVRSAGAVPPAPAPVSVSPS